MRGWLVAFVCICICICICQLTLSAQAESEPPTVESSNETFWQSVGSDLLAPTDRRVLPIFLYGSALTVAIVSTENITSDPLQKSVSNRKPLGGASAWGNWAGQLLPNALYAGGMLIDYWASHSRRSRTRSLEMFKGTFYATMVALVLKDTIQEPRPDGSDRRSFPSGHSTSGFAFAAVVGAEHPWYWGVPSYLLASLIAFSRINDNRHYLHDVVGGATIGLSYGLGIYHRTQDREHKSTSSRWQMLPFDDLSGAMLSWRREF